MGGAVPAGDRASAAFRCERLSKSFGTVAALRELSLEVRPGTLLGLLGPNGAGKTTLIRILLGLTRASSGRAWVLGEPVPSRSILPRIGYMPQNLAVYTDLKVRQNLLLFGRLFGLGNAELERRSREVLDIVRLSDVAARRVSELSGGTQRRVSLACALVTEPPLLLLDEPTVGVDPELRAEFWDHFRDLASRGRTIVMTTHYMEEATRCDQVALLYRGRLLACEAPASVKARTSSASLDEAFLALVRAPTGEVGAA